MAQPVDRVAAYRWRNSGWEIIPFQIDERQQQFNITSDSLNPANECGIPPGTSTPPNCSDVYRPTWSPPSFEPPDGYFVNIARDLPSADCGTVRASLTGLGSSGDNYCFRSFHTDDSGRDDGTMVTPQPITQRTFVVTGLSGGETIYAVLTTVDTTGNEGSYSAEVSATAK